MVTTYIYIIYVLNMYGKSTSFCYEFSAHHRVSLRPRDGFWDVSISTETTLPTAFEDGVIQVRPGLDGLDPGSMVRKPTETAMNFFEKFMGNPRF